MRTPCLAYFAPIRGEAVPKLSMAMTSTELTPTQARQRARRFRQMPTLRCKTEEDIRDFVNEVGVCMLFPATGFELPNVYQAVAGFAKPQSDSHSDPTNSLTWRTKDAMLDKRWWYYGKLIRNKATLVSLSLFPAFYALSENFGEDDDYLQLFADGKLSVDARGVYEALLTKGPMHAIQLKRESNFYGEEKKAKFDRAMSELQTKLMVMSVGVAEAGAWRYAYIYDTVHRWLPEQVAAARSLSRSQARTKIARQHLQNVIVCPPKELARLFGWTLAEAEKAVSAA